jgi:hypothetical protein
LEPRERHASFGKWEEGVNERKMSIVNQLQTRGGPNRVRGRLGHIDRCHRHSIGMLDPVIHHQDRIGTGADHALNGSTDKDVSQELFAVSTHHDEICLYRLCDTQNAVKCVAGDDSRAAADSVQLGDCADLLAKDSFHFAGFDLNQFRRLIIIYDVHQREFRVIRLRQKAGPP